MKESFSFWMSAVLLLAIAQCAWAQEGSELGNMDDDRPQHGENGMSYYIRTSENGEKYASTAFAGELKGNFVIPAYITDDKVPVKVVGPSWEYFPLDELLSFTIPETVEEIKSSEMCRLDGIAPKFQGFFVDESNPYYEAREGAVYKKDGTLIAWTPGFESDQIVIPEGTTGVDKGVAHQIHNPEVLVFPSTLEFYDDALPTPRVVYDGDLAYYQGEVAVICYATTPPQLGRTASKQEYQRTTAYVPKGCVEAYASHEQWGNCYEIKEITDGIPSGIQPRKESLTTKETVYSLDGRMINGLQKGIIIVKGADGLVKKYICK